MLEVQKYLYENGLEKLKNELSIRVTSHETLPLMILNYDQLASPKLHPVVRECRGLILRSDTFELVARSFKRFFNWGECPDLAVGFRWDDFSVVEKMDGSLITIFNWENRWYCTTRGSFAQGKINNLVNKTWEEVVCDAYGVADLQEIDLDPKLSYVCELCSTYNKVVITYPEPTLYLLAVFDGEKEINPTPKGWGGWGWKGFRNVKEFHCKDIEKIIEQSLQLDEGVVIRDCNEERWKVKNPDYLIKHRLANNGVMRVEDILHYVLTNDIDEFLIAWPEYTDKTLKIKSQVETWEQEVVALWVATKDLKTQKDFALAVKDHPMSSILFNARKEGIEPKVRDYPETILKWLH